MGAWGVGHFDNDAAVDFVEGIAERPDWFVLESLLRSVRDAGENDDAIEYDSAISAIAIIAHLARGYPIDVEPSLLRDVARLGSPTNEVVSLARAALHRAMARSWYRVSWEEAGQLDAWLCKVEELERVLSA